MEVVGDHETCQHHVSSHSLPAGRCRSLVAMHGADNGMRYVLDLISFVCLVVPYSSSFVTILYSYHEFFFVGVSLPLEVSFGVWNTIASSIIDRILHFSSAG